MTLSFFNALLHKECCCAAKIIHKLTRACNVYHGAQQIKKHEFYIPVKMSNRINGIHECIHIQSKG